MSLNKMFVILLIFVLPFNSYAGSPPVANASFPGVPPIGSTAVPVQSPVVIPGSDAPNWYTLTGKGLAAAGYIALFALGNTAGTQFALANSKNMEVHQVCLSDSTANNSDQASMGFSTATFTDGTGTDPTGVKYYSGSKTVPSHVVVSPVASTWVCWGDIFTLVNTSGGSYYPLFYYAGGGTVYVRVTFKLI
ncbi:MAG: hypothetical protein V4568_14685 [Pseudomonadota bacterium]